MPAVLFEPARPEDDAALRALLAATPLPGAITLGLTREPSFFAADAVLGERVETLVARPEPGAAPVALAQRAVRTVWLGGAPARVAYLGGLRVHPAWRGRGLTRTGWQALGALHRADPVGLTLAALAESNRAAEHVLVQAPGGGPAFEPVARVVTLAVPLRRRMRHGRLPERPGAEADDAGYSNGARTIPPRDLAPALEPAWPGRARTLATPDGRVTLWDPAAVRQTRVVAYAPWLHVARPALSRLLRLAGCAPLPAPGEPLRAAFAADLRARSAEGAARLLSLAARAAASDGHAFLLAGWDACDPYLVAVRRRFRALVYRTTLYGVRWKGTALPPVRRPIHAEIATY
ncbi:MAG: hypothetical protein ACK41D_03080 [Rubricoccaceae bacterium]